MPDRFSFLKARYCRAVLRTALNSQEEDARRLVYCLATEPPTVDPSPDIGAAERNALDALANLARRVEDRGVAAIATHWKDVNAVIEIWIEAAYQGDDAESEPNRQTSGHPAISIAELQRNVKGR